MYIAQLQYIVSYSAFESGTTVSTVTTIYDLDEVPFSPHQFCVGMLVLAFVAIASSELQKLVTVFVCV